MSVAEPPVMRRFRLINEPGKPVGPHVDFARDAQGNVLRQKPLKDGEQGEAIERMYYPGDVIETVHDLNAFNGTGDGKCKKKFEELFDGPQPEAREMSKEELLSKLADIEAREKEGTVAVVNLGNVAKQSSEDNSNGKRPRVTQESLEKKNYKELMDLVKAEAVDLKGASKKEDVVKIILQTLNG